MAAIPGSAPAAIQVSIGSSPPLGPRRVLLGKRALLAVLVSPFVFLSWAAPASAAPIPVGGRVMDEAAAPIAGARVSLLPVAGRQERGRLLLGGGPAAVPAASAATDAQGRFALSAPGPGMWRVRVEAAGRVPVEYALEPLLDEAELPVAMPARDAGLELRVTDGAGRPLAARAAARSGTDREGDRSEVIVVGLWQVADRLAAAGPNGLLRLPRTAGEPLSLVVAAPGRPPVSLAIARRAAAPATVELPAGPSRILRAADERGRPVAGALVWDERGLLPLGETDAAGRWTAAVPLRGALRLSLSGPDGRHGTVRLSPPREEAGKGRPAASPGAAAGPAVPSAALPAAVTLAPASRLSGRVLDRSSREGVAGAFIWLATEPSGAVQTDRAGGYELSVPAGSGGVLQAAAPGHVSARSSLERGGAGAGEQGPTLLLPPAARLTGRVVDAAGRPVMGAEIQASHSLRELVLRSDFEDGFGWGPTAFVARSDATGRFRFAALRAGWTFDLYCARPGFASATLEVRVPEPPDAPGEVEVVLAAGRRGAGRVVDGAGRPVAGARIVSFKVSPDSDPSGSGDDFVIGRSSLHLGAIESPESPGPTGSSGADGRFTLADLGEGRYRLEVAARGFAPGGEPAVEVGAGAGEVDLGTVTLAPEATVEGRVVDAAGRPVPGAVVEIAWQEAGGAGEDPDPRPIAGADGRFTLGGLDPGVPLMLTVSSPGFITRLLQQVVPPTRDPLEVVLERGGRLAGRLVDGARRPVAGATVALEPGSGRFSLEWMDVPPVESDEEGAFEIANVPPGALTLRTWASGFQPHRLGVEVPAGGERAGLELVLAPGAVVVGQVLAAGGEPVPDATVYAFDPRGGRYDVSGASTVTDADGRFRLEGIATGPRVVQAGREGYPIASREIEVAPGENQVTLTLPSGRRIAGRVVDEAGNPVAGAVVMIEQSSGSSRFKATSGEDGAFAIAGASPGLYVARGERKGYLQAGEGQPFEVRDADLAGVEVRLAAASVTLTGRLLGRDPADLRGASVYVVGGGAQRHAAIDAEGRYRVADLAPGTWMVLVIEMGVQAQRELTIAEGASEVSLDLDLSPKGFELAGVALRGGAPIRGAILMLWWPEGTRAGSTDHEGAFRFKGLAAGTYWVVVQEMASSLSFTREVEVESDVDVRLDFGSGRIAGRVVEEAGGAAVAGAAVELRQSSASASGLAFEWPHSPVESDSTGAFRLEAPEGPWRVVATKAGYAAAEVAVELGAGEEVTGIELRLAPTEGVTLEVALASRLPLSQVEIAVLSPADQVVSSGTFHVGEGGRVRVGTVPPGSWELVVQGGDSATVRLPVTSPGPAGRVVLPPAGGIEVEVVPLAAAAAEPEGGVGVAATLALFAADGRPARLFDQGVTMASPRELRRGRAGVTGLAPGRWTVRVTATDGRTWTGTADVSPGQVARVTLQ